MKSLLQRVTEASVCVNGEVVGAIDQGILVFVGVEAGDAESNVKRMAERLLGYRVFADDNDRMNCSVRDITGGVLLVSQFTMAADTNNGTRASFSSAAAPADAERLFTLLVETVKQQHPDVATGRFAADMQVTLTNDGPVTFLLES